MKTPLVALPQPSPTPGARVDPGRIDGAATVLEVPTTGGSARGDRKRSNAARDLGFAILLPKKAAARLGVESGDRTRK
jgi:hypothetical protein